MQNFSQSRPSRRKAAIVGLIYWILVFIGLIAVITFVIGGIRSLADQSDRRARFEQLILPVVMMDPVPFSDAQDIDDDMLMLSAMWAALLGENRENYSYDENGLLLVPASDLDVSAAQLFGPDIYLEHRTFDDYDASYLFDPEISAYRVPLIAKVAYSPLVESIEKTGEGLTLKVGYIAPGNIWSTQAVDDDASARSPDKYMYYDLVEWDQGHYISAVRDIDENAPPRS